MSQENVELGNRAIDALNRRDIDAFLALIDPEVEFYSRIVELEGGGPFRGHEGIRRWWQSLFSISPDFRTEIEDVRAAGDLTVTRVRQRGHGVESDAPMEQMQWFVTQWRNGRMVRVRVFVGEIEALEAAGLSE
jgi:ketosteroid isomerase-like protein